jgi:hypothetical protein
MGGGDGQRPEGGVSRRAVVVPALTRDVYAPPGTVRARRMDTRSVERRINQARAALEERRGPAGHS